MELSVKEAGFAVEPLESPEEFILTGSLGCVKAGKAVREKLCCLRCPAVLSL